MGRVKWFHSKGFLMVLHMAKAVMAAVWGVATLYIGNHKKQKKGGGSRKRTVKGKK